MHADAESVALHVRVFRYPSSTGRGVCALLCTAVVLLLCTSVTIITQRYYNWLALDDDASS